VRSGGRRMMIPLMTKRMIRAQASNLNCGVVDEGPREKSAGEFDAGSWRCTSAIRLVTSSSAPLYPRRA